MTAAKPVIDAALKQWATETQARYIDLINAHGSQKAGARAAGVAASTIREAVASVRKKAAEAARQLAIAPKGTPGFIAREMTTAYDADGGIKGEWLREGPAPTQSPGGEDAGPARDGGDGFRIKGVSTQFDGSGNVRSQWVKTTADDERRAELMREAFAAMAESLPRVDPTPSPDQSTSPLCNLFTLTDKHIGMMAWHKEGGADWDLKIAERVITDCFEHLIRTAPSARVAVINQLGDFLHYDGLSPVTPLHGHLLDADGRFSKMVGVAIRVLRRIIDYALTCHDEVHLVIAEGNHDMASSVWLRQMFAALYENEPRLQVNDSELPYYVYQHGRVMLAFHHGHLKKNDQLPLLFAAQFPRMWGETTHRIAHTGHRHHVEEKEHSGMTVIQHPTLAARDAYAARGGWIADRSATAITYHSAFGQVARNTVSPDMLADMAA